VDDFVPARLLQVQLQVPDVEVPADADDHALVLRAPHVDVHAHVDINVHVLVPLAPCDESQIPCPSDVIEVRTVLMTGLLL